MTKYQTLRTMLAYDSFLKVKCACGHHTQIPAADARQVFGDDAAPYEIRRRMRCNQCKEVGKVEVWIWHLIEEPPSRAPRNIPHRPPKRLNCNPLLRQ